MMTYRLLAICIVALLLSACGGEATQRTPAIEPLVSRQSATSREAGAASLTSPGVIVPTLLPTAPPTPTGTPALATAAAALPELTQRGYATLVLLRGLAARVQDLAQQAAAADAGGQRSGPSPAQRLAVEGLHRVIEASLAQEPPDQTLAGAWSTARATTPQLQEVLDRWADGRLPASDVAARLVPIQAQLDRLLATADQQLGSSYGVDADRIGALAGDALGRLRAAIQAAPAN